MTTAASTGPPSARSARAQRAQDVGGHLDRRLVACARRDAHHARSVDETVWEAARVGEIREPPSHHALDRNERVLRVARLRGHRVAADVDARRAVVDDRRNERTALAVRKHDRDAVVAHRRDERVGRAEVDADRPAPRLRRGNLVGLGDLQQRHHVPRRTSGTRPDQISTNSSPRASRAHACTRVPTITGLAAATHSRRTVTASDPCPPRARTALISR